MGCVYKSNSDNEVTVDSLSVAVLNLAESVNQIRHNFVREREVFLFLVADEVMHGGIVYEFMLQGMDTFLKPGFQSTAVVYDVRVFTVGKDTVPLAEVDLPLVSGIEPVFHEVIFEIEVFHLAAQDLIGRILVSVWTGVRMFFHVFGHFLANVVFPPVVEIDELDAGIEVGRGNLVEIVYEDVVSPLIFHHTAGITVNRRVPQIGEIMADDDITVKVDDL